MAGWSRNDNGTTSTTSGGGSSNTSGGGSITKTESSSGSTSSSTSSYTENMTPTALAALEGLIAQLMGGGTPEQQRERALRERQIDETRSIQNNYSKEAAFADAKGAMSAQLTAVLAELLPAITRASEGSGTSQSSLRALTLQKAGQQAADSAATLGLKASTDYGSIATSLAGVLEALSRPTSEATNALINALNTAKGAVESKTVNQSGSTSSSGTSTTTSTGGSGSSGSSGSNNGGSIYGSNSMISNSPYREPYFVPPVKETKSTSSNAGLYLGTNQALVEALSGAFSNYKI